MKSNEQLRVDLTGDETQKVFDQVLTNLARSAPPMPGFRKQKGGSTVIFLPPFTVNVVTTVHLYCNTSLLHVHPYRQT